MFCVFEVFTSRDFGHEANPKSVKGRPHVYARAHVHAHTRVRVYVSITISLISPACPSPAQALSKMKEPVLETFLNGFCRSGVQLSADATTGINRCDARKVKKELLDRGMAF
jgi:hypothetical protein